MNIQETNLSLPQQSKAKKRDKQMDKAALQQCLQYQE